MSLEPKKFEYHSKRFCRLCRFVTTFEYNKIVGHSACYRCGSRFGVTMEQIEKLVDKEHGPISIFGKVGK